LTATIGQGVAWSASAKNMMSLWNGAGSGVIARIYRIWMINNQLSAVTGVTLCVWDVRRVTVRTSGGAAVTPVKHDTASGAVPAQVIVETTAVTLTTTDVLLRGLFSNDEPAANAAMTCEEMCDLVPLALVWDSGYGSGGTIEPLTAREGEGWVVTEVSGAAVGVLDVVFEFTL
jgi:hypothetical protein